MMSSTDPWITIGRTFDECLALLRDPLREVWLGRDDDGAIAGFIVLVLRGALVGYIQAICVDSSRRSGGVGSRLIAFAEERIFREFPNVFLCVSSFNTRARALYERLGYEAIGEIREYLIRGASETLMRKTVGPIIER